MGAPDFVNSKGKPAMDWNVVRAWADKMESLLAGQPTESPSAGKAGAR